MNDFIEKLLDDIHNINPELAFKRQTEYHQNYVNKVLNEQCDIPVVVNCLHEDTFPVNRFGDSQCINCGKIISHLDM